MYPQIYPRENDTRPLCTRNPIIESASLASFRRGRSSGGIRIPSHWYAEDVSRRPISIRVCTSWNLVSGSGLHGLSF
jgi:hypothetical protein